MIKQSTIDQIIAEVKGAYGIPIKYCKDDDSSGASAGADLVDEVVELYGTEFRSRSVLMSLLVHEVAHILCKRQGIYKSFHNTKSHEEMTEAELYAHLCTAWRAECYVERMAKGMMASLFPGYLFQVCYGRRKVEKGWFDKSYLADYKKMWRRKKLRRIDREMRVG